MQAQPRQYFTTLRVGKNASAEKVARKKQKALELKDKIDAGESFIKIADLYSEDPSVKNNHGDLGFFREGDMVKVFSSAEFRLEQGIIREPVRSPFGFHLIEVLEKKKESKETFESVKNKMMQKEYKKRFKEEFTLYVNTLKQNAQIISK